MQHWDRGTSSRLQRVSAPIEQGSEISVQSDQMDPPEEQQSHQGTPNESNSVQIDEGSHTPSKS